MAMYPKTSISECVNEIRDHVGYIEGLLRDIDGYDADAMQQIEQLEDRIAELEDELADAHRRIAELEQA